MEEERSGRQVAEAERVAVAEEAAQKVAAAAAAAEEAAVLQSSLAARLAAAEADLADTRTKLADARMDAEKKLREHWETSRCVRHSLVCAIYTNCCSATFSSDCSAHVRKRPMQTCPMGCTPL